jgi:two-component system chemotaxis sensor kinase CheA
MTQTDPSETFRQEAQDVLEQLEQSLLDLGASLDDLDLIDSAFRALHTIKGSGAMFGFTEVAEFVHEFETAFDRVRKGDTAPSDALVSVSLDAKDHISLLIAEPATHAAAGTPILTRLRVIVGTDTPETQLAKSDDPITTTLETDARPHHNGWTIRFKLPKDALSLGANPALLLDELRELGSCTVRANVDDIPTLETLDPEVCFMSWDVTLHGDCTRSAVEEVFLFVQEGMELEIAPLVTTVKDLDVEENIETAEVIDEKFNLPSKKVDTPNLPARGSSSLRVAAERLDELLDHVGELVIAQARLSQISEDSRDSSLMGVTEEIERLSAGLRDITMGIRMVPIGTLFNRFRRLVHDLSSELGKNIEFATSGEQTELDKTVIESLADPLVHIIRNAIDHGLENPEDRIAAGKQEQGTVRLAAAHEGAEVAISVSDDGAGLNVDRIRQKAEETGLITSESLITDSELNRLIFHPGFSTAKEITSVSGRGVGMDVVSRTMDALRGRIDVSSRPNNGTTVTLRLPLTLAIIDGMLVRVGCNRYSIPLSAVEECVELPAEVAENARGRNFLSIRGELVPFLRLRELFGTKEPEELHQKVVIVSTGEQRMGLVVDQILGNTQTVIKSLSRLHANIETFAGATIMGDGAVALILDVVQLMRSAQHLENRLRDEKKGQAA